MQATATEGRNEKGHFLPGYTANPAGKPRESWSLVSMIKRRLKDIPKDEQFSYAEKLINAIVEGAIKGNPNDRRLIMNYIEGMPKQQTDITSGGLPLYLPAELLSKNDLTRSPEEDSE